MTEYQYDDASRLLSVTQPNGDTVSYTYDGHGNRLSMTYPDGKTAEYVYDGMDRLISVKGVDGVTTTYEYDALGRRTKTAGGKETTEYTYDEVGDLIGQTTTGSYDLALAYTYDLSGRMTGESRTENGATLNSVFTYDPLGQLTGYTRSDGISESYTYDAVGNMTRKVQDGVTTAMTYNAANQLIQSVTGGDTTTYTYDPNGNLTAKQTATGTTRYAYNALNLLQSYTGEDGYTETYTYNANRLLSSVTTPEATTSLTWDILYGDGVVISETTGKNTTDYTYGLERISSLTGSTRTEYIYDVRGSVAAEVSYNNAWYTFGGTLGWKNISSKSYIPFGEQIGEKTSGFGYNGEYYNAATGMVYLRARFYEPEMNRFSQKDVLRGSITVPTSLNRYLYVWNDPINYVDPSGEFGFAVLAIAAGVGAVVGGAVSAFQSVRAQKNANNGTGRVNVGKVVKDALIGAAVGATSAVVATATATVLAASVGAATITGAVSLTATQSVGVGILSSVAGGAAARYTNSALNNTFSPERAKTNPLREATKPSAVLKDSVFGAAGGALTHVATGGIYQTPASQQYERNVAASRRSGTGTSNNGIKSPSSQGTETGSNNNSTKISEVESPQGEAESCSAIGESGSGIHSQKHVGLPKLPEGSQFERNVLNSYEGGKVTPTTYEGGTTLYRVGGKNGGFWSLDPPPATEYQWRVDYAIKQEFCNDASTLYRITVPEGSSLSGLSGKVGSQGMGLYGGANQVYIDYRAVPSDWIEIIPTGWR